MSVSGGILLALVAGNSERTFAAPTKYTGRWKWENIWAIWAVVAFFVVPWFLAILTIPHLFAVYGAVMRAPFGRLSASARLMESLPSASAWESKRSGSH